MLVSQNPEIKSLKIACETLRDEKSENLREQPSIIHLWIRNTEKNNAGLNGTWLKAC